jgi:hypothetical protein
MFGLSDGVRAFIEDDFMFKALQLFVMFDDIIVHFLGIGDAGGVVEGVYHFIFLEVVIIINSAP